MSRLIQPRGLKYSNKSYIHERENVEAYTASWIEMMEERVCDITQEVEAYTASWIEMSGETTFFDSSFCRGLYSLVD